MQSRKFSFPFRQKIKLKDHFEIDVLFFKSSSKDMFLLILERAEGERESKSKRDKNIDVRNINLLPSYMP